MPLFPDPDRVADRPPAPRGLLTCEIHQANADLAEALAGEPAELARSLSVAVLRLGPSALQKVARLVLAELGHVDRRLSQPNPA